MTGRSSVVFVQLAIILFTLAVWQWAYDLRPYAKWLIPDFLDPYFISKPSEIWTQLLRLSCLTSFDGTWIFGKEDGTLACLAADDNNLFAATLVTLKNTLWGFAIGVSSGYVVGLLLGRSPFLSSVFEPFLIAFNSIPRIALVPLVVMMFGIGDTSKIVTAWLLVFFLVFFNTFEGARQVDRSLLSMARLLQAKEWQVTTKIIIPSTLTWVFASLTPSISFALIGVIVGEFIGARQGLGRIMMEAQARGQSSVMMATVIVLMIIGVTLALGVKALQSYLLRWQDEAR
ncbi:NitT/TauT family transport system permease protein [Roseovarius pacificus]|uniref:NitT/TauT family transport system permease protein n=1 Tax=Roseovarius pacificus TaxID=337701 RepID=A0A1M7A3Y0_9RHOB|nr:ABC transporter permease [Roseovarius pacificus]GGO53926.1 ABC transporter permease [Roseovarius pacificus]SHL37309.1 NitT/TauT family transport system permease protein [Roseovarius pacificus]